MSRNERICGRFAKIKFKMEEGLEDITGFTQ